MVGIILAAGDGTRLKNSRKSNRCKPLTEANKMPLIVFSLENLRKLKAERACIVVGKEAEQVKQAIGNTYKGLAVQYILQPEPKGLIHALMCAVTAREIDEPIVLQLADEIFINLKTERILQCIHAGEYDFFCGVTPEDDPAKIKANYAVRTDADSILRSCEEKPAVVVNNMKGTGLCFFGRNALRLLKRRYCPESNCPRELCDYMNLLIGEGQRGLVLPVGEKEFNINTEAELTEAEMALQAVCHEKARIL